MAGIFEDAINERFDRNSTDFMEMVEDSIKIKLGVCHEFPYAYEFYLSVILEEEKLKEVEEYLKEIQDIRNYELYEHILKKTDQKAFKEGIDTIQALKVTAWISEGFFKEGKFKDLESVDRNMKEYRDLVEKLLYK